MDPKVTIITPSYNQGHLIEETILSVLGQTYKNIQYILVDGGSNDSTMEIVKRYEDKIDVIIHEKDNGQSNAINKGFKLAKGKLVGWVNSDDLLYPDCVKNIVSLYQTKPDGVIFYGSLLDRIDLNGNIYSTRECHIQNKDYLLRKDYNIIQQGSFYLTSGVRDVKYLDESIHFCMDLQLWLKLLDKGSIYAYRENPIAAFRSWAETKTSTGKERFFAEIIKTLKLCGAKEYYRTILKLRYYIFKVHIKNTLGFK